MLGWQSDRERRRRRKEKRKLLGFCPVHVKLYVSINAIRKEEERKKKEERKGREEA